VSKTIEFGIPGLALEEGDHVCAFYRGPTERDDLLVPYLLEGLAAGEKCTCVMDSCGPEAMLPLLAPRCDLGDSLENGRLDLLSSRDSYLLGGGFVLGSMIAFWRTRVGAALTNGFAFARSAGEMTWALRAVPGVDNLVSYESELNRFLPEYPQVILCLYDLAAFSGDLVIDIVKTHPKLLVGGAIVENPYYLDPDEFLTGRPT
jgi:hypothetical protein